MYEYKSSTVRKAEHWRLDAFELWCWRRLLRVPWTARRSNQSILKMSPGSSLEGMMLKLKLQYFGHVLQSWLIGKDSDAGRDWGQDKKGMTEDEMAGWHHWLDVRESEWTPGVGDGQGRLACCNSWSPKESDRTEQLNWTELTDVAEQLRYCYLLKASIILPVDANSWLIGKDYDAGKDWGQKEKRMSEEWHHHGMMAWMTSLMQ